MGRMKLLCSLYCSLWFLLLLGAGSLLILLHLPDIAIMVQPQTPGQYSTRIRDYVRGKATGGPLLPQQCFKMSLTLVPVTTFMICIY